MKKGTRVSWQVAGAANRGHGTVLTDEADGKVLVEVDSFYGEPFLGFHPVICCTVTWLTPEPAVASPS